MVNIYLSDRQRIFQFLIVVTTFSKYMATWQQSRHSYQPNSTKTEKTYQDKLERPSLYESINFD